MTLQMWISIGAVFGSTAWVPSLDLVSMRHPDKSANWRILVAGAFSFGIVGGMMTFLWVAGHWYQ